MNNWTSQPMAHSGYAVPSFESFEGQNLPFFEDGFEDFNDGISTDASADMTLGEFYEMLDEASRRIQTDSQDPDILPFIPMLLKAAPMLLNAVPGIVQGVSSMINRSPAPRPSAPVPMAPRPAPALVRPVPLPRPRPITVRPVPRPYHSAPPPPPVPTPAPFPSYTPPSVVGTPSNPNNNNATMATLLALLSNPSVQNTLQTAVGNSNISIGNSDIPVSAAVDIIGQLAGLLAGNETPPAQEYYPDFLFDSFGNALVNPDSAEEAGNLLLQRLQ